VELAETLQAPAIVLSDQFMGQSRAVLAKPVLHTASGTRLTVAADTPDYKRYRDTESGVSPMAIPGTPGVVYTADGLEHTEGAIPSSGAREHSVQLDKRLRKLARHDYGPRWADIDGDGPLAVITFGSASGPVREAVQRAAAQGVDVRLIVLRLLAPLQEQAFASALKGVDHVMVVEQNHGAQLLHYLRGWADLPRRPASFHRPGPLPLRPAEVCAAIVQWAASLQVQEEMA
jgi:2-oxoglutarate/2-oxoacid ferredoxin oxidoreductase subunit alpha